MPWKRYESFFYIINLLLPGGSKRSYVLKQTYSFQLQVCLGRYDLLLPPGMNGLNIIW